MIDASERRTYIGASEAAAVVNLSRWGSPVTVWARKVGLETADPPVALRMWLGERMEPILAELYESRTGRKPRTHQRLVRSKSFAFIGAHPDYVRLEVKTAQSAEGWGDDGAIVTPDAMAIPLDYYLQVQQQMFCTGWDACNVAVLIRHDDFRVFDVPRHQPTIEGLVNAEVAFWQDHVLTGVPPVLDGSEAASAYLRSRFPVETQPPRIATPEEAALLLEVQAAKRVAKEAAAEEDRLTNILRAAIGEAAGITDGRIKATWKTHDRTTVDPGLARLNLDPATLATIQVTKPVRTLLVGAAKEA